MYIWAHARMVMRRTTCVCAFGVSASRCDGAFILPLIGRPQRTSLYFIKSLGAGLPLPCVAYGLYNKFGRAAGIAESAQTIRVFFHGDETDSQLAPFYVAVLPRVWLTEQVFAGIAHAFAVRRSLL